MCINTKACEVFLKNYMDWECCSVDGEGHLRGLLVIWNPLVADLKPFTTCSCILIEGKIR